MDRVSFDLLARVLAFLPDAEVPSTCGTSFLSSRHMCWWLAPCVSVCWLPVRPGHLTPDPRDWFISISLLVVWSLAWLLRCPHTEALFFLKCCFGANCVML